MSPFGTLLPRANPAACPQLAKADFASSSQHVRKGQLIAELEAEIEALQRQARQSLRAMELYRVPSASALFRDLFARTHVGSEQRFCGGLKNLGG
jgi:hypothetical protein